MLPVNPSFCLFCYYHESYWPGLAHNGMLRPWTGVRFQQSPHTPPERQFNELARRGSRFHEMISRDSRVLMIDRGCGGLPYGSCAFDHDLLDHYASMLDGRFLGVQLHEWVSNLTNEYRRLKRAVSQAGQSWSIDGLRAAMQAAELPFTVCGTIEHYAASPLPENQQQLLQAARDYLQRKQAEFGGYLFTVDAFCLAQRMAFRQGARANLVELGVQTPLARLQVAAARGIARQFQQPWGAYYDPWGGEPFSTTSYLERLQFDTPLEYMRGDSVLHGGAGGSSRALQRRFFWWAYLAGCNYLAEELGGENTFHDWQTWPLTPYGEVVRDFVNFVDALPQRPQPWTPVAVVLPVEHGPVDTRFVNSLLAMNTLEVYATRSQQMRTSWQPTDLTGEPVGYLGMEPTPVQRRFAELLAAIVQPVPFNYAREQGCLTHSEIPDVFDIVYADAPETMLAEYGILLCRSSDVEPLRKRAPSASLICIDDPAKALGEVRVALTTLSPCVVSCEEPDRGDAPLAGIHWQIARMADRWLVGLFNHAGVYRSVAGGEQFDPAQSRHITIRSRQPLSRWHTRSAWPSACTCERRADGALHAVIPAGGLMILELDGSGL